MADAAIEIFIGLSKYGSLLADIFAQNVAAGVTNHAKKFVRFKTHNLQGEIRTVSNGPGDYASEVNETYALAQEFGREDLERKGFEYGYTPYMRPGADEATTQGNLNKYLAEAEEGALNRSKL